MPAKKAPSANDTPNSSAAPNAAPSAMTSTDRRNSSREPVCAMECRIHGITRLPTISMTATKAMILAAVTPRAFPISDALAPPSPWSSPAMTGNRTSARTMAMSSTISQPTAIRPRSVSISLRSCNARNSTTVLATDSARPNTSPAPMPQPSQAASPMPSRVAQAICAIAPGMAIFLTESRSSSEKCRPTPNISRMTPISASWAARFWSAT